MPTVLVTGANRGIGRAIVEKLAASGWDVLAGARDPGQLAGLDATPIKLDITSPEDIGALDAALPARLDAVVNNAGIVVPGAIECVALDEVRRQFEVNVVAQVAVTQAVLPRLRESKGRVVFISSVSGRVSTPFTGTYNSSKFALEGLADALRMELRPWGIAVSLVEPGAIDTAIWRDALDMADETESGMTAEQRALYAKQLTGLRGAIKRTQKQTSAPEKVAAAVHRALTAGRPRARYLVGADARVQVALRGLLPTPAFDSAVARLLGSR
jgi:NAD(P)-dependent dehydrogenase (short-subunit alcohol dehydrogenase family)